MAIVAQLGLDPHAGRPEDSYALPDLFFTS